MKKRTRSDSALGAASLSLALALLLPISSCSEGDRGAPAEHEADSDEAGTNATARGDGSGAWAAPSADTTRAQDSPAPPPPVTIEDAATAADVARLNASEQAREPETVDWSGGDADAGEGLYAIHCAACHGADGGGNGPASAALNPKPRDFSDGTFYLDANANDETGEPVDLARVIESGPRAFGGSKAMPPWEGVFTQEQLRNLVAYVQSLSGRSRGSGASSPS